MKYENIEKATGICEDIAILDKKMDMLMSDKPMVLALASDFHMGLPAFKSWTGGDSWESELSTVVRHMIITEMQKQLSSLHEQLQPL